MQFNLKNSFSHIIPYNENDFLILNKNDIKYYLERGWQHVDVIKYSNGQVTEYKHKQDQIISKESDEIKETLTLKMIEKNIKNSCNNKIYNSFIFSREKKANNKSIKINTKLATKCKINESITSIDFNKCSDFSCGIINNETKMVQSFEIDNNESLYSTPYIHPDRFSLSNDNRLFAFLEYKRDGRFYSAILKVFDVVV